MAKNYRVALYFNMVKVHHQGVVNGVIKYARGCGDWNLFGTYWPMYEIGDFRTWNGDGIIAAVETAEDVKMLTSSGMPVVDTSGAILDDRLSLITNDNQEIGRIGGEHLLDAGLERFAFCGASKSMWSMNRLAGFEKATRSGRVGDVVVFGKPIHWWHSPEFSRELADFLAGLERPCGVMSANDIIGMNVVGACRMAGLRIPEDIAIVSVDNEELLCELSTPPLSSIAFNRYEVGLKAAERLDLLMRGRPAVLPEPLLVPPIALTERASSAIVAVSDPLVSQALGFIKKNAVNNLGAGEVADRLHTSRRNLERRFRDRLGRTVLEEIHRNRIAHAKRLLREKDVSVKRVAALSGFKTMDRFAAIFTRYAGMSPTAFRKIQEDARR